MALIRLIPRWLLQSRNILLAQIEVSKDGDPIRISPPSVKITGEKGIHQDRPTSVLSAVERSTPIAFPLGSQDISPNDLQL